MRSPGSVRRAAVYESYCSHRRLGDIVAYRCAASCEPNKVKLEREDVGLAIARADDLMMRILIETNCSEHLAFLSGEENFRYQIDPNYKANRKDVPRPLWLQPVREFLVLKWGAKISNGIEADDNLGIHQTHDTIICSIDKDLLQIPGAHYNFVTQHHRDISIREGWINFYIQLIMGDRSDNIPGYDGKMRQVVPKFLQSKIDEICNCQLPRHMYIVVKNIYELGEEALHQNAQLLYILRHLGDKWIPPT